MCGVTRGEILAAAPVACPAAHCWALEVDGRTVGSVSEAEAVMLAQMRRLVHRVVDQNAGKIGTVEAVVALAEVATYVDVVEAEGSWTVERAGYEPISVHLLEVDVETIRSFERLWGRLVAEEMDQ